MTLPSLSRIVTTAGLALATALAPLAATHAQLTKPFLWELTKGDRKITLFGSLHVGKADFFPLP